MKKYNENNARITRNFVFTDWFYIPLSIIQLVSATILVHNINYFPRILLYKISLDLLTKESGENLFCVFYIGNFLIK